MSRASVAASISILVNGTVLKQLPHTQSLDKAQAAPFYNRHKNLLLSWARTIDWSLQTMAVAKN